MVTKAQIEDQQLRSVGDLLLFVPGASYDSGEGNRDQLVLRGNSSTADFFVDGVRDDVQYFRDFYNVDRVEVLKGPNAMIFGRGGGGGIINRVLKRPTFAAAAAHRPRPTIGAHAGSRATSTSRCRAPSASGSTASTRIATASAAMSISSATASIRPRLCSSGPTRGSTSATNISTTGARPTAAFPPMAMNRSGASRATFFGDPDKSFAKADVNLATVAVEHQFGGGLTLRNRTMFGDYGKFYQNIFPSELQRRRPGWLRCAGYNNRNNRAEPVQPDRSRLGEPARRDRSDLAVRVRGRPRKSRNRRMTGELPAAATRVPISDPTVDADVVFAPSASDANNRVKAKVAALYVQDQIRPADWLEIVAGLRFDSFKIARRRPARRGGGVQPPRPSVVAAARPGRSSPATACRSTPATAGRICRNRATSSAA